MDLMPFKSFVQKRTTSYLPFQLKISLEMLLLWNTEGKLEGSSKSEEFGKNHSPPPSADLFIGI